ncbi:FGGY-family carbohydrate kinase [Zongyangia hominis]|uniref:Carbohydrate kinase n=1 Tax=Zongyangia hominis TaxID=2763677 RepID=A0A926ICJ3_9FIRM|nr:FGGY-family carbohydrate kinase [Zongyangia hominis]MBC8571185.1 carbohydrate kinase [Zongyangia hominis]
MKQTEGYVLCLDKGSTNIKAVAFDLGGRQQKVSSERCRQWSTPAMGWIEQDMEEIWGASCRAISGIFDERIRPDNILGVGVTGQGSSIFPIDASGNPVRPGILSSDGRGAAIMDRWQESGQFERGCALSHFRFSTGSAITLTRWLKEREPENYEKMAAVLFSKDWIRYRLTGDISTDPTDACGGPWLDLDTFTYSKDFLDVFDMGDLLPKLPPLRASHAIAGQVTGEAARVTGLKAGTPVITGIHDMASFPLGVGRLGEDEMVTALGTFGFSVMHGRRGGRGPESLNYASPVPGELWRAEGDCNTGSCLDHMVAELCRMEREEAEKLGISVFQYIDERLDLERVSSLIFHPFLLGSLSDAKACGGFYGLRSWHGRADMIKAVYEGIVFSNYSNMLRMERFDRVKRLWLVGGGARSDPYGQIFADVTGLPVRVPEGGEVTARGVALGLLTALGVCGSFDAAMDLPVAVRREFVPDPGRHAQYQKKFALYARLEREMKPLWREFYRLSEELSAN